MTHELFQIGMSHLLAPVSARERAAVPEGETPASLQKLAQALQLKEAVLLSTCSRLELYGISTDVRRCLDLARLWFIDRAGPEIDPALVSRAGQEALSHLFRVCAGLDSWIIGESEILGQVKRAYEAARSARLTGPNLNRAFQSAVAAGKAARTQTAIQNGVHSIGGAAALLARSIFGERDGGMIVVFGAGEAAEAAARHLAAKKFQRIFVANRTQEKAGELARRVGGEGVSLERGMELLAEAEVAVFSTASAQALLDPRRLDGIMLKRRQRPLFIVDLGLPRNVDPACAGMRGAFLYDLDDLKGVIARSTAGKAGEKEKAEAIVSRAAAACAADIDKAAALRAPREAAA